MTCKSARCGWQTLQKHLFPSMYEIQNDRQKTKRGGRRLFWQYGPGHGILRCIAEMAAGMHTGLSHVFRLRSDYKAVVLHILRTSIKHSLQTYAFHVLHGLTMLRPLHCYSPTVLMRCLGSGPHCTFWATHLTAKGDDGE